MTYSIDFRRHVLALRQKEGLTYSETSARFAIGIASLTRWNKTLAPKATRENRPRKIDLDALARDVEDHPDAYQYERAARFFVTPKAIWQALRKLGVTYKKSPETSKGKRRHTYALQEKNLCVQEIRQAHCLH